MSVVFLDTVGLLALWDAADQWHAEAAAAFAKIVHGRDSFLTTTFVLLECGNAAARRPYRNEVDRLRNVMEGRGEIVAPTANDWHAAWTAYEGDSRGKAGIVDHISFIVMRRLGIRDALTNDQHFKDAGFRILF